ncbi:MAG: DUF4395 domain-containing protein [Micropruina sp.]|uniref:DUF4395 domain-containing protein n=1 Tax=Micropruina sp. TaxID=2737536 RepID=UPI0039E64D56
MSSNAPADSAHLIDPRGPRFAAAVTAVLLATALLVGPAPGWPVLLVQTLAFAAGSLLGLPRQPWGWIYRVAVRPRLAPPGEPEDARPPRFAQTVGLLFGLAGLLGVAADLPVLFYVATGFALVAALLNAVFDFCLGCEMYLIGRRLLGGRTHGTAGRA